MVRLMAQSEQGACASSVCEGECAAAHVVPAAHAALSCGAPAEEARGEGLFREAYMEEDNAIRRILGDRAIGAAGGSVAPKYRKGTEGERGDRARGRGRQAVEAEAGRPGLVRLRFRFRFDFNLVSEKQ